MVYHLLENQDPDKETKEELSYAVHYGYGILQGGVYGLSRTGRDDVDLTGGLLFGTGLWLFGDELAVRPPYFSQRNFGSSALEWCFVAAGRLDVYVHGGQMLWDYAAGQLILKEAGGESAALDGGSLLAGPAVKRGVISAASPALFREWRQWVQAHS